MLTVNIQTKEKGGAVVAEETLECKEVVRQTMAWKGLDGKSPEHPGVRVYFPGDEGFHRHIAARDDGLWYDFFVMNEAGKTVSRFPL